MTMGHAQGWAPCQGGLPTKGRGTNTPWQMARTSPENLVLPGAVPRVIPGSCKAEPGGGKFKASLGGSVGPRLKESAGRAWLGGRAPGRPPQCRGGTGAPVRGARPGARHPGTGTLLH